MSERTVLRLGAGAAIVGGVLALITNFLHPRITNFEDPSGELLGKVAGSEGWVLLHLGILAATLLLVAGLYVVLRSLGEARAQGLPRLALGSLLISTPVAVLTLMIDGYATKEVADSLAAASGTQREAVFAAADAVAQVGWAAFMGFVIMLLGVTPVLLGLTVVTTRAYPAVFGWPVAILGAAGLVSGVIGTLAGPSQAFFLLFTAASALLTLWVLSLGVVLWRRAEEAPAKSPAPRAAARA